MPSVSYDRPVTAKLVVQLANGETFEPTAEDLAKFGLVRRLDAYMAFNDHLAKVLIQAGLLDREKDTTEARVNPLRYIAEVAINYADLLAHPDMERVNARIVAIEKTLRQHLPEED